MSTSYTLITGATSGIGYALAKECAKRGQPLILASRNTEKMKAVKQELESAYTITVEYLTVDLSISTNAEKLFEYCQQKNYTVSILINNAGIGLGPQAHVDHALSDIKRLVTINLDSLVILSTLFGKIMKEKKFGYILNIASTAAFQPMPYAALYGASKAFVLSFSEAMHTELADYNVGVTAVCPGITDTNFFTYGKPNVPGWLYKLISPELVAQRAMHALYAKKNYIVPYFQHWLIAQISRFLSRKHTLVIMKKIEKVRKKIV